MKWQAGRERFCGYTTQVIKPNTLRHTQLLYPLQFVIEQKFYRSMPHTFVLVAPPLNKSWKYGDLDWNQASPLKTGPICFPEASVIANYWRFCVTSQKSDNLKADRQHDYSSRRGKRDTDIKLLANVNSFTSCTGLYVVLNACGSNFTGECLSSFSAQYPREEFK